MIKVVKGYPTKKSVEELCEKHALRINDTYGYKFSHAVHWQYDKGSAAAELVAQDLRDAGFDVTVRPYERSKGLTGQIKIGIKT